MGSVSPGIETQASGKDKHCYQDLRVRLCKMGRIQAPLEAYGELEEMCVMTASPVF